MFKAAPPYHGLERIANWQAELACDSVLSVDDAFRTTWPLWRWGLALAYLWSTRSSKVEW